MSLSTSPLILSPSLALNSTGHFVILALRVWRLGVIHYWNNAFSALLIKSREVLQEAWLVFSLQRATFSLLQREKEKMGQR